MCVYVCMYVYIVTDIFNFREADSLRILFTLEVKLINLSMKTIYCSYARVFRHSYQPATFTFQYAIVRNCPLPVTGLLLFALLWNTASTYPLSKIL